MLPSITSWSTDSFRLPMAKQGWAAAVSKRCAPWGLLLTAATCGYLPRHSEVDQLIQTRLMLGSRIWHFMRSWAELSQIVLSILFLFVRRFHHASEIEIDMDLPLLCLDRSQDSYQQCGQLRARRLSCPNRLYHKWGKFHIFIQQSLRQEKWS